MTKRRKFVLVSLVLALGLLGTQLVRVEYRYYALALLGAVSYGLSAWALVEDMKGIEWVMLLILPALYPVSVGLFYFLLPQQFLSRIFILGFFGVGMYALLLTSNIFSVAAIRTIQLLRAAHAVGFLLTLVTGFFLFDTILSFKLAVWLNVGLVAGVSWLLLLKGLWSMELTEEMLSSRVRQYSVGLAISLGLVAGGLSFWPVTVAVGSLFLVSMMYVGLGLAQQYLVGRLFRNTVREYLLVGLVVLVTTVLMTRWTG